KWTVGAKYDFLSQQWSAVTGDEVNSLIAELPGGVTDPPPYKYTVKYDGGTPAPSAAALGADPSTYSSGLCHVPLTGNDPQTATWLTVDDESKQVWQTGQKPGAAPVKFKDVQVSVADDVSRVDGVTFLVTALPPANAALGAQPDPYTPLPTHKYSVSLV